MSPDHEDEALPPRSAPFADRLRAAMAQSGYESNRQLAKALGKDGAHVGKWLGGVTPNAANRRKLAKVLRTPPGYLEDSPSRSDRLRSVEADVAFLLDWVGRGFEALGVAPDLRDESRRASDGRGGSSA